MEDVLISIIMPVINTKEGFLKKAIESILGQTFGNFEFIIIDDTQNSKIQNVLNSYLDKRIVLIKNNEKQGFIKSLNMGLNHAKGKYIARMDDSDISTPKRLEIQYNLMEENENIGILGCSYSYIQIKKEEIFPPQKDEEIKELIKNGKNPILHSSVIIRKEILKDTQYSENFKYCEDLALWSKLTNKTEFSNTKEILYKKRKTKNKNFLDEQSLNIQTVIFINIEKFYNQSCAEEFKVIRKLKDKKRITTKDYKKIIEKQNLIEPNETFLKYARKRCLNPLIALGIKKYKN